MKALRKSPCGPFVAPLVLTSRTDQLSPFRAGLDALLSVSSQKHLPGDCEAHKAVLLGDLQTDYKFTGDNQGI